MKSNDSMDNIILMFRQLSSNVTKLTEVSEQQSRLTAEVVKSSTELAGRIEHLQALMTKTSSS